MNTLSNYELSVLAAGAMVLGLLFLIRGGDWTIDAASFVAEKLGLSKLFIGATIVAFGTSVPELFTSVNANLSGYPGISLGNVVGSNIANILLVLGVTVIILPLTAKLNEVRRDLIMMLLATAILVGGMLYGIITAIMGAAMFLFLASFVAYQYVLDRKRGVEPEDDGDDEEGPALKSLNQALLFFGLGLGTLVIGSELLVRGAVATGNALGVPEAIIGLTVVAVGTSLPELFTCVSAARKGEGNMIIGNIVGSNVFNILSIIGITALTKELVVDPALSGGQMWAMVAATVALAACLFVGRVNRAMGAAFIVSYLVFCVAQYASVSALAASN